MLSDYIRRLPPDIVQFIIIPYTYSPQSKEHLLDIRSFVYELRMIDSIYSTQYNYKILLYDLLLFVKEAPRPGQIDPPRCRFGCWAPAYRANTSCPQWLRRRQRA